MYNVSCTICRRQAGSVIQKVYRNRKLYPCSIARGTIAQGCITKCIFVTSQIECNNLQATYIGISFVYCTFSRPDLKHTPVYLL